MTKPGLWDRITFREEGPVVGPSGVSASSVVDRLAAGQSPASVAEETELGAADLIAAIASTALGDDRSLGLPLVSGSPVGPALGRAFHEANWAGLVPGSATPGRLALMAGMLQILDHWAASHEAAQRADDLGERATSAYWHGIAHRREPDSGNASYWFRRVGRPAAFGTLAKAAGPLLEAHGDPGLTSRLLRNGEWSSQAMIDLCADGRPSARVEGLARRLQRLEMIILLEATAEALGIL